MLSYDELAETFANLCLEAGEIAMDVFSQTEIQTRTKSDGSLVTQADELIETYLLLELDKLLPGVPSIAEEKSIHDKILSNGQPFLLIDPIDGTREFIAHGREFTINIGLVVNGEPRVGAVLAPALGEVWFGGFAAFHAKVDEGGPLPPPQKWGELRTRRRPLDGLIAVVSRWHLDQATRDFLSKNDLHDAMGVGSSLKFCRIAEGVADLYPRLGASMEWDTCAADAILRAAGGIVCDVEGAPLRYGKEECGFQNGPFIAYGDPAGAKRHCADPCM